MEAKGELLGEIRPPRLEDAGLEDCALPPECIEEAFRKAATAVQSITRRSFSDDESEGRWVDDPWPTFGDSSDFVGIGDGIEDDEGCAGKKGGNVWDVAGDKVVVIDAEKKVDWHLFPPVDDPDARKACIDGLQGLDIENEGKACVDGLQGLEIGNRGDGLKGKKFKDGEYVDIDGDDEGDEREWPILAEGE